MGLLHSPVSLYAGARRERVEACPRFVDGEFCNTAPVGPGLQEGSSRGVMREFFFSRARRMPSEPLPTLDPRPGWAQAPDTGLRATWLGHSTVLVEIDGLRVLTDPVWCKRASPSQLMGPKRFQPVPVTVAQLPELDAVVLSHDHYDHLDAAAIAELGRSGVPIYTSLGVGLRLELLGVPAQNIHELDWWESARLVSRDGRRELQISAAPSQHFSGRGLNDRNATAWSSFVLTSERHRVFFSGDTGLTPEFAEIAARLGPFDLVMLEVGAFHPAWGQIHLGPDNALEALALLGGGAFLPVHWGTFNLAIHDWDQPAERLFELAPSRGVQLLMPKIGAPIEPSRVECTAPWWRELATRELGTDALSLDPIRVAPPL
ncbi:hypothetical protein PPSIR1_27253 [Plesiocystis pacifica SIR-1]|uniref:Metallo-beta-lactamase domain-containing protein n=1 Tax=Plesiocystis pacifica SIR-1 TaxID=391625 RepID=A6G4L5_9BACT|nr:MBL fold metallo-hydrolase [Plesiocystis pacifica]EDM79135.1 hypothetical protein PPSIR1_27253 [Plesiocystis pacifica SIR-1]